MKKLDEQIDRLLEEAAALDAEEDKRYGKGQRGDELPEEMKDPKKRAERLREAARQLEAEKKLELAVEKEKRREKIRRPRRSWRRRPGRRPRPRGDNPRGGEARGEGAAQFHRPGLENHAPGRRLPAVLQRAGGGGRGHAVDSGAGGGAEQPAMHVSLRPWWSR